MQILQLEMERLSLAKAVSDRASKQRLQALDSQLNSLKAEQVRGHALSCSCLHVLHLVFVAALSADVHFTHSKSACNTPLS